MGYVEYLNKYDSLLVNANQGFLYLGITDTLGRILNEIDIKENLNGTIELVNIAGSSIKTLVTKTTFLSGHNEYIMDLTDLSPGIYLVSIFTDKGFKTQRLIISQ